MSLPKISFILPCARIPFFKYGKKTVDSIIENHPYNCEILLSSKERINYLDTIYIKEDENNKGAVKPANTMALAASGDFICMLNDDYYLKDNIYPAIEFMKNNNLIGLTLIPFDGKNEGVGKCPFYNNKISSWLDTMMFPIVHRKFIENHGELMFFKLKHYYGDNTISIRLWKIYRQSIFTFNNDKLFVYSTNEINKSTIKDSPEQFEIYKRFLKLYGVI